MDKQYGWIATVQPSRFTWEHGGYVVTKWFDNRDACIRDLRKTDFDIPDCWGSYEYYLVIKRPFDSTYLCCGGKRHRQNLDFDIGKRDERYGYTFEKVTP